MYKKRHLHVVWNRSDWYLLHGTFNEQRHPQL